jgi:hypothetical protein
MGSQYWGGLMEWLKSTVLAERMIGPEDLRLFHITDDLDEAVALVEAHQRLLDSSSPP